MAEEKSISFIYRILDHYSDVLDHIGKQTDKFSEHAYKAGEHAGHGMHLFGTALGAILTAGGLENLGSKAFEFGKKSLEAFEKAEIGIALLKNTLNNLRGTGVPTFDQLSSSADKLAKTSLFTKSSIMTDSFGALIKYSAVGRFGIDNVSLAAQNLAFSINKNATGSDLANASNVLGRALQDPFIGANIMMRRYHIAFTNDEMKSLEVMKKSNDVADARLMIFKKISEAPGVKGAMGAVSDTSEGHRIMIMKQMTEIQERLGAVLAPVVDKVLQLGLSAMPILSAAFQIAAPIIEVMANAFSFVFGMIEKHKIVFAVLGGLLVALAVYLNASAIAEWALNIALAANPIILIILAIAALVLAILWMVDHWKLVIAWINQAWNSIKSFFAGLWQTILNFADNPIVKVIGMVFLPFIEIPLLIIKHWKEVSKWVTGAITDVMKFIKPITDFLGLTKGGINVTTNQNVNTPILARNPVNVNTSMGLDIYTEKGIEITPMNKSPKLGYNVRTP